jgi:hypothetical protein
MGVFQNNLMGAAAAAASAGGGGFYTHQIANSVRNSNAQDGTLKFTAGTPTSSTTFTLSYWVKKYTNTTGLVDLFVAGTGGGTYFIIGFATGPEFWSEGAGGNFGNSWIISTAFARDTSAWYHVVHRYDSTQSVSTNRVRLYVNGEQITSFRNQTMQTDIAQDEAISFINESGVVQAFGGLSGKGSGNEGADLQMAEIVFNDGQSYGPDSYGEFKNGVWIPKDPSGLTFGNNGYWLKFESNSDLGNDSSGNNNDFTAANLPPEDQLLDSPTFNDDNGGNYCTINPLNTGSNNTLSEGNLKVVSSSGGCTALGTMSLVTGYKWYFEARCTGSGNNWVGIIEENNYTNSANTNSSIAGSASFNTYLYGHNGLIYYGSSSASTGATFTTNDVMGVLVDLESATNTIQFYKGGAAQGSAFSLTGTGINYTAMSDRGSGSGNGFIYNFGQDSTFAGAETAATNRDSSGRGEFLYSDSTGGLAICSGNLPLADAINPAETDDDYPQELYSTTLYTGNNADQNINVGLRPDFLWIKRRDATYNNYLFDSTRGVTNEIRSDNNSAQSTTAEGLKAFLSTGFTTGDDATMNENNALMVVRSWRANAGTTSSGSGTLTSTHQVDPSGGFSIVKYVGGNNTWDNPGTVSHGLSRAPDCILLKGLFEVTWEVFHSGVGNGGGSNAASNSLVLDTTAALYTNQTYKTWNGTMPTSSLFTVNGNNANNTNAAGQIAYCFANTEGYIKAGSYEGNGNANGSFVYCGFRPAFIMTKSLDSTSDWEMFDDKRLGYNPDNDHLTANTTNAESTTDMLDILSNGFKFRIATDPNVAESYVYLAMAHNPFKYATAR